MMKSINFKKMLVAVSVVGLMSGCAQPGPKTQKGALIGAGTGAVVGAVSGRSVLKSAAVGTAIGAGVGYYEDTK
ncbi:MULTISPECIES: YMGG-like glycine zipper-containing protein [Sulfurovum]|uniref:YMGG-like glycine zipper-containing protein n=1 Tax=Sulfurovum xiamenensis TaxID=3019066 RepID=A0ABT7QQV3_9BACT|nr:MULTISPECIES: YMGG-like glycine zipper-containing protein [Sulfurovum]MDM5263454.1 YMGG-like glycine zipper-containing protein [Sulfurovum xiamenensis]